MQQVQIRPYCNSNNESVWMKFPSNLEAKMCVERIMDRNKLNQIGFVNACNNNNNNIRITPTDVSHLLNDTKAINGAKTKSIIAWCNSLN